MYKVLNPPPGWGWGTPWLGVGVNDKKEGKRGKKTTDEREVKQKYGGQKRKIRSDPYNLAGSGSTSGNVDQDNKKKS